MKMLYENETVVIYCRCGTPYQMHINEFWALANTGKVEGLKTDCCNWAPDVTYMVGFE